MHTVTYYNKDRKLKEHQFPDREKALGFAKAVAVLQVAPHALVCGPDAWALPVVVRG